MLNWRNWAKLIIALAALLVLWVGIAHPYRLGFPAIVAMVLLSVILTLIEDKPGKPGKKKKQ